MRGIGLRISAAAWCLLVSATVAGEEQVTPQTLVKVDDFAITNLHLALFASQTGRAPDDAEGQIALLNELVNSVMVANSAQGRELAAHPEVAAALEVARIRLIAQTFVRSQMRQTKIDEARLRELYESEYLAGSGQEFKARHILLDSENAALEVIADLDKGADFATLATERSIGPSKSAGGDLGWFEPAAMVPEFSAATATLADGAYSKAPVKTQFGWHVILREASRALPPPDFDSVRPELERRIQQEQVAKAIDAIRNDARIEVQNLEKAD